MKKYLKEGVLWVLMAIPFTYLAFIWNSLPEQVPIQFNGEGRAISWSSKTSLLFITAGVVIGTYLLTLITPKRKIPIAQMGFKYDHIRFILTLFISILMTFCLHLSHACHT